MDRDGLGRVRGAVPVVVVLVLALGVVALLGFSDTLNPIDALLGRGAIVTVPNVVESARPRAVAELEEIGLEPEVTEAFSLDEPKGVVVRQSPEGGDRVRTGTRVQIVVSKGANRVEMPDAVGHPIDEVRQPFDEADIPLDIELVPSERVAKGIVMEQSPGPGIRVTGVDEVSFVVSDGPADRPVPDVVGRTLDAAAFELGRSGFVIGEIRQVDDAAVPAGAVVSVSPKSGTVVPIDTAVDVVVSNGPAPVAVPDVVNNTEEAARTTLEQLGFVVRVAGRLLADGEAGVGAVFEQYPPVASMLRPGQEVTIVVGRELAPSPPPPTTTTTTTSPPASTSSTTTTVPRR